jgi:S1-C subfamily serine protease
MNVLLWRFLVTTLCIACAPHRFEVNGFLHSNLQLTRKSCATMRSLPSLSCTSTNEDILNSGVKPINPILLRFKKIFLPTRKFMTTAAIFGTSLIPLKSAQSSASASSSASRVSITSTRLPSNRVNKAATSRSEAQPVIVSSNSFVRDAVRQVGPSVVRVDCEREISPLMTLLNPEAFKDGDTIKVSGSGIVVSTDGYMLTNSHVVQQAKSLTVTLSNGRSFKAVVVAFDELTDLAVLKADVGYSSLPKAPLGDSSSLQSGDWVIAVGCPVGLDFTVTLGIVSSPKRSAHEVGAVNLRGTYIQTDAALNSGNSGGPLVDAAGNVVGINTMVRTNTEAIGFAIPINRAKQIYEILKLGKKPSHAYFGVDVMTLTPDFAR